MLTNLTEIEKKVLDRELKLEEEAKKARSAGEAGELPHLIEDFVAQCDDPNYFRTVYDKLTGKKVILSDEDLAVINRIRKSIFPDPNYDPYEPMIEFFSNEVSIHPVMNRQEPKAAFVPSLSEKRALTKLVALIRSGRLKLNDKNRKKRERDPYRFSYDLWLKEGNIDSRRHRAHIPAPKMALPGHSESFNPPTEYLLTADDIKKWESQSEEERDHFFLPERFPSLRSVPFYEHTLRERFERCLELYMCPRQRIRKVNVDPDSLLPKLPKPKDFQPFPSSQSMVYKGHTDIVHSISVEPQGQFIVSGSEDCTIKFWEVINGRCWRSVKFDSQVRIVAWCPNPALSVVAVVTNKKTFMINSNIGDSEVNKDTDVMFDFIKSELAKNDEVLTNGHMDEQSKKSKQPIVWKPIDKDSADKLYEQGARLVLESIATVDQFTWHSKGDYFALVMPEARLLSVVVGHLGRHQSQNIFKRSSKYIFQRVAFHPKKPILFAADERTVVIYDMSKKEIVKKLTSGLKNSSCLAIHPGGDNILLGSYDPRLVWFDTDLSVKPYKTLRYHKQAIRGACFHKKYPLFASCSDDAHVIVSHGMVYNDLTENPLIVPLKMLHGHEHRETLAVTDCQFHHTLPWIFSSGGDKTLRLYT